MIRLQKPELKPYEDHAAWQATWNEDEELLARTPPGYWISLIHIAQVKCILLGDLEPDLRLRFLEILNKMVYGHMSVEAMQRVTPACDTAMKMLAEMRHLNLHDQSSLLTKWNVIAAFINLNPSILEAMKFCRHPNSAAA